MLNLLTTRSIIATIEKIHEDLNKMVQNILSNNQSTNNEEMKMNLKQTESQLYTSESESGNFFSDLADFVTEDTKFSETDEERYNSPSFQKADKLIKQAVVLTFSVLTFINFCGFFYLISTL